MGGKGSKEGKEGEQLSQLELNYYMGVQTTPEVYTFSNIFFDELLFDTP